MYLLTFMIFCVSLYVRSNTYSGRRTRCLISKDSSHITERDYGSTCPTIRCAAKSMGFWDTPSRLQYMRFDYLHGPTLEVGLGGHSTSPVVPTMDVTPKDHSDQYD